jgi:hypothetical protein
MTDKPNHQKLREILELAGSTFVGVGFKKKDGTPREARFNPRDFNEIKGTGKPSTDPNIFRFREVNNKEEGKTVWRSLDARRITFVRFKGQVILFKEEV